VCSNIRHLFARSKNIHIIEIDACTPFDPRLSGVSIVKKPQEENINSPFCFLSPFNAAKMADIVTTDFKKLSPEYTQQINENLSEFRTKIFNLKSSYDFKFMEIEDLRVCALSDSFIDLTYCFNIDVDGYFLKQEYYWTEEDYEEFKNYLLDNELKAVIHDRKVSQKLWDIIESTGASLTVLNSGDPGYLSKGKYSSKGLLRIIQKNLDSLYLLLK